MKYLLFILILKTISFAFSFELPKPLVEKDVLNYKEFENVADIILCDRSGLEHSLEWNYNWIKSVPKNITKMIAGNINIDKLEKISKLADIVDVSGALETNKVKDILKIKNFLCNIKKFNNEN